MNPSPDHQAKGELPHLLHVFATFGVGGPQVRIASVMNGLAGQYRHTVIGLDGNTACASRIDDDVLFELADADVRKDQPIRTLGRIRAQLRRLQPDLLLTYNWGAIEWALVNRLTGTLKHIHLESGFGKEEADKQIPRRVWARRLALQKTLRVIVPSLTLVDIATNVWRLPGSKVHHIPNGVDCERYDVQGDPASVPGFEPAAGQVVIGALTPLRPEKNLPRLLRAFAAMPDLHAACLLIVGEGPERQTLEALAVELGIEERVYLPGHTETPEKVLPLMDIFSISSDTEQMPNSLIQAMAASRPVAAVDVGDVKAIVAAENRTHIVPRSNLAAFAEALNTLVESPDLRRSLGSANCGHVRRHYDISILVSAYASEFARALG